MPVVVEVSVALYVPSPLSVTEPRLPRSVDIVTVPPLAPIAEPDVFLRVTVIVELVAPALESA